MGLRRIIKAIGLVALAIMAKLSGASAADNSTNFTDITAGGLGGNNTGGDGQHWDGVGKSLAIAGAVSSVALCAICGITCVCDRCISRRSAAAVAPSEGDGAGLEGNNEPEGGPPVMARPQSASTLTRSSSSASPTGQHQ